MNVVYTYIPTPTRDRLLEFIVQLGRSGVTISRLGERDPPRKWAGTTEDAVGLITTGGGATNYTFLEAAGTSLSMTIELRQDPRWGYSTVSFFCPGGEQLDSVIRIVLRTLSPHLCIRGTAGLGKNQAWDVLH